MFFEAGPVTEVDLERSPAGGIVDLTYDHFTGNLKPAVGVKVSLYKKPVWPWDGKPGDRSGFPGEKECNGQRAKGQDTFDADDLKVEYSIFCIVTAEGHDGFLYIQPIPGQKPDAYDVYTYVWVR